MKKLEVKDLKENFFEAIGKEWMLVTAGTKEKFNTMTASWGGIGWLWNKPVAFVFIRPERYTYEFVEKNDHLTLSFLGEENKKIHAICGSKSGRNIDKVKDLQSFTEKKALEATEKIWKDIITKKYNALSPVDKPEGIVTGEHLVLVNPFL